MTTRTVLAAMALTLLAPTAAAQEAPSRIPGIRRIEATQTAAGGFSVQADEEDCHLELRRMLLCGEVAESDLTTRSCKGLSGEYFDIWVFAAYRGDIVAAGMSAQSFASQFLLFTPSPARLYDLDLAEPGQLASVAFAVPTTGVWGISSGSQPSSVNKTGRYLELMVCGASSKCKPSPLNLCLGTGARYRVQAAYHNQFSERFGFAGSIASKGSESGFFVFGDDKSNIELMVKILDFGSVKKVFWGQLTNLNYKIVVTDLVTDKSKTYFSQPAGCGGSDGDAFAALEGKPSMKAAAACRATKGTACLLKGRFEVSGTWRNQYNGTSGEMGAARISDLTGSFYFGSASNVELLVKFADLGSKIGFFYGAMSDLEYTLNVKDTATGEVRTYFNPAGRYCGGLADLPR